MPRRILKAKINFLSLCPRGANQLPTILKADDTFDIQTLVKANGDFDVRGELLNVVYAPELRDSQGDIASAEVIKDAMYESAKTGMNIDIRHNNVAVPKDKAYIAESFIVQKGDARFADFKDYSGKVVDVTGAWATVVKIEDADLKAKYKSGEWNGVSMGGHAAFAAEKSDEQGIMGKFIDLMKQLLPGSKPAVPDGDIDMKPEEVKKMIDDAAAAQTAAFTKTLTDAGIIKATPATTGAPAAPSTPAAEAAPVFKGDWTKPEDVKNHAKAVKLFELRKSVKWEDQASVDAYLAEVAKLEPATTTTTNTPTPEQANIARLEKELENARRQSNQPVGAGNPTTPAGNGMVSQLAKEDVESAAAGMKVAAALNKSRGYGDGK